MRIKRAVKVNDGPDKASRVCGVASPWMLAESSVVIGAVTHERPKREMARMAFEFRVQGCCGWASMGRVLTELMRTADYDRADD